jgi:hypothetical protein
MTTDHGEDVMTRAALCARAPTGDPLPPDAVPPREIPQVLERSEIPRYFRQFRDANVLKKLAHRRVGPLYQLIGRSAWYETADIIAWLESRKSSGPEKQLTTSPGVATNDNEEPRRKRRGRPTKTEQRRRAELNNDGSSAQLGLFKRAD